MTSLDPHKATSAHDLVDALTWMHQQGLSSPRKSTAAADSAGALALGGLLNEAPRRLGAAVVRAGFLDPLSAMLDPSLPLAIEEREEWGDPGACDATRAAMAEYSPYNALRRGERYPAMMLVVAEQDSRVPYTQSLRYLARLRNRSSQTSSAPSSASSGRGSASNPSGGSKSATEEEAEGSDEMAAPPPQILLMRESGGHMADGGRYRRFEQASVELAFLMHAVGDAT